MSTDEGAIRVLPEEHLPRGLAGARAPAYWGMWMLIATEAMLFAALIASYFFLRFQSESVWPPDGIQAPAIGLPLIMSAILLSSSVPVHLAQKGIESGNLGHLRAGLGIGFLLGAVFLGLQLFVEYPEQLREFSPTTNAYGSLFFTLTGFHGSHVLVGLAYSAWTQVRAWRGDFGAERHLTVQLFAMYWHFVDVVWIFVLSTIYLSPR